MPVNGLAQIFGGGKDFVPHIEEAVARYIVRAYVMAGRVSVFNDMEGFNVRKLSEYLLPRVAQELAEDTAIPDTVLSRARRAQIDIKEVGDRYRVSDRRSQTDLANILADVVAALGKSIGDKMEIDLINTAMTGFVGGTLGNASTDYTIDLPIDIQYEFSKRQGATGRGTLFHVIHPFQAKNVMKALIDFNGSDAGANLEYRNQAIRSWRVPGFDNLDIAVSSFIPRRIVNRVQVNGTGGTFRLSVAGLTTGAITVSGTVGTMATNIKNALDALGIGTWTATAGADNATGITITPPATLYVMADQELSVAVDPANPTLDGQKSAYDLVTGTVAGLFGTDLAGASYGVRVLEVSATARSLMFYRGALALDMRQSPTGFFELENQGRTAEYSMYAKYGTGYWMPNLGMFIESKANSAFALG